MMSPENGASVPEASPELNEYEQGSSPPSRRNKLYLLGGIALLVIALCIALPVALIDNDSSSDLVGMADTNEEQVDTTASTVTTTTGSESTEPMISSPNTNTNTNTNTEVKPTTSTTVSRDGDEEQAKPSVLGDANLGAMLVDGTLPLFGSDITGGYANQDELERALILAFRQQAQNIIEQNIRNLEQQLQWEQEQEKGREEDMMVNEAGPPMGGGEMMMEDAAAPVPAPGAAGQVEADFSSSAAAMDESAAAGGGGSEGVTDFQTNNQEESIDEADLIKADANYIYASYGDYIIIWSTEGRKVAQVKMPRIPRPDKEEDITTPLAAEKGGNLKKSMIAPDYWYEPKPNINSMLLTDTHLVATVDGYNQERYHYYGNNPNAKMLYAHRACQIRLYEKQADGNLTFVGSKDVIGNFVDARSIGDNVHLATASGVDTWSHLGRPLDSWQIRNGTSITVEEYTSRAHRVADRIVPNVARKLMEEIRLDDGSLPTLLQINQWFTQTNSSDDSAGAGFTLPYYETYDVVSNVGQVTSFNVQEALTEGTELSTTASAFMAPSYFNTLYGTKDHLVLATSGWDWNPTMGEGEQTTYVVALEINDASTEFLSVGTLRGHLLNQYALDIVGNELRAATTVERFPFWWGPGWGGRPGIMIDEEVMIDPVPIERANGEDGVRRKLQASCPLRSEECMDDDNFAECHALKDSGCDEIAIMESCPLQFACSDNATAAAGNSAAGLSMPVDVSPPIIGPPRPPPESEESRTQNFMSVLKLVGSTPGQMEPKGQVGIGEKHERITSVRFFDNVAYAVTFERTDPFYVLDMSVPEVLGELKLPGFSSYLHSMNADNTLLLAVGQNATDEGVETGLMVTVFDATDPSDPKVMVSHTFENDNNAYSGSSVQWDYKAFRFIDGKLVVPLEIWYHQEWDVATQQLLPLPEGLENFRGFAVLDIDVEAATITEAYRISHMKPEGSCHYCGGYLPQRSFVYSGDLMTIHENIVVSTGLHSGEEKWRMSIGVDGEPAECCW